ncbi:hypothetical protein DCAR_0520682 [Daucus carota subsp. sativus]|uniref:Uncharacterized protein n=1 Tax=Daucus carota subsp. sativus TaxID=79200 RepID=A0AAF0X519_DAUCS|nr:hypothetical protein DCAR_0520682 [Daucus carota subsp. sativus]
MNLKSFLLGNLVSLCMKIINLIVVVGFTAHDVYIHLLCASGLVLDRPHTITVLDVPYLLFHFIWKIKK